MFDRDEKKILKVSTVVALFIFGKSILLSLFTKDDVKADPLNKKVFDFNLLGETCCSWWPITHFIMYGLLAYFFPHKWKFIFLIGLAWELFEVVMSIVFSRKHTQIVIESNVQYSEWWSGSKNDIIINGLGILTGIIFSKYK